PWWGGVRLVVGVGEGVRGGDEMMLMYGVAAEVRIMVRRVVAWRWRVGGFGGDGSDGVVVVRRGRRWCGCRGAEGGDVAVVGQR
ncbi:hypothetical protein Tco_0871609, partial [Tanacetum coccineum]